MNEEILDLLILGDYPFAEVAEEFDLPVREVKKIYSNYLDK